MKKSKKLLPAPDDAWRPSNSPSSRTHPGALEPSASRKALIQRLEALRESKVLVAIEAGDDPAPETLRYLFEHLRTTHRQIHPRVDLVVFTRGAGDVTDLTRATRAVSLLREHAREFSVLVPSQGYGLGTLLSIGADQVLMHPLAALGRLSAAQALEPSRQLQGWLHTLDLQDDAALRHELMRQFVTQVTPRHIARDHATHSRLRAVMRDLIHSRVRSQRDDDPLLTLLNDPDCPLAHPFDRRYAKQRLGLPVHTLDADTEVVLWDLFSTYEHPMGLLKTPDGSPRTTTVIESLDACHCHVRGEWVAVREQEVH